MRTQGVDHPKIHHGVYDGEELLHKRTWVPNVEQKSPLDSLQLPVHRNLLSHPPKPFARYQPFCTLTQPSPRIRPCLHRDAIMPTFSQLTHFTAIAAIACAVLAPAVQAKDWMSPEELVRDLEVYRGFAVATLGMQFW